VKSQLTSQGGLLLVAERPHSQEECGYAEGCRYGDIVPQGQGMSEEVIPRLELA